MHGARRPLPPEKNGRAGPAERPVHILARTRRVRSVRGSGWFSQQPDGGLARRIRERPVNGEGSVEPVFYAVVSLRTSDVVEFFAAERDADRFVARVCNEEPQLADDLCVERILLEEPRA